MQISPNPEGPAAAKALPDAWPRAGSTSYYTLLHCSDAALSHVRCTLDLINTISSVLVNVSEPSVAEQKVHWWHEELARLARGEARHPATAGWYKNQSRQEQQNNHEGQASHPEPTNHDELRSIKPLIPLWLSILSCNANERFSNAADDATFRQRIEDDYTARLKLFAHALNGGGRIGPATVPRSDAPVPSDIIIGLGLCHRLRRFNQLQSGGAMVWPDSMYKQHELQPENLHDPDKKNQLLEMFDQITEDAVQALTSGLEGISTTPGGATNPAGESRASTPTRATALSDSSIAILTAATLRLHQMKMWQRNRPDLLRQYQGLTPFRKSLVTWRTRRKLARLQKQT